MEHGHEKIAQIAEMIIINKAFKDQSEKAREVLLDSRKKTIKNI